LVYATPAAAAGYGIGWEARRVKQTRRGPGAT
jgi:hypothetical protein